MISDSKQGNAKQFGRYILDERIAMGGMAEIFRAHIAKEGFEKDVCIKRVLPHFLESEDFVTMFRDEAAVAARLQHANVVQVFDFGEVNGTLFLAMELVDGADLNTLLKKARQKKMSFQVGQAVQIAIDVCRGLHHAHSAIYKGKPLKVVHRDISPHNILISRSGEVKVTDFGIAKAAERATHTNTGVVKGKLSYMAPEQLEGVSVDHRLDQFSTAIVLWEMLTLEKAFSGDSEATILRKVMTCDIPPPRAFRQGIPSALEDILMKALDADREQRFENMRAFERALTKFLYDHSEDPAENDVQILFSDLMAKNKRPPTVLLPQANLKPADSIKEGEADSIKEGEAEVVLPQKNKSALKQHKDSVQEDLVELEVAHAMKTMVSGTSSDVFSKPKTPISVNRIDTGESPEGGAKTAFLEGKNGGKVQVELSRPFAVHSDDATLLLGDEGVSDVFGNKSAEVAESEATELVSEREKSVAGVQQEPQKERRPRSRAALLTLFVFIGLGAVVFWSFSSGQPKKERIVEKKTETKAIVAEVNGGNRFLKENGAKSAVKKGAVTNVDADSVAAQKSAAFVVVEENKEFIKGKPPAPDASSNSKAETLQENKKKIEAETLQENKKKKWVRRRKPSAQNKAKKGRGIVFIDVEGTWAEISEKGKALGQTPYQASVPVGRHQFILYNPATKKRKTVTILVKKGGKHTRFLSRL